MQYGIWLLNMLQTYTEYALIPAYQMKQPHYSINKESHQTFQLIYSSPYGSQLCT